MALQHTSALILIVCCRAVGKWGIVTLHYFNFFFLRIFIFLTFLIPRLNICMALRFLRIIYMLQIPIMPMPSRKLVWFVLIASTVQSIKWWPGSTKVEHYIFTTNAGSQLVRHVKGLIHVSVTYIVVEHIFPAYLIDRYLIDNLLNNLGPAGSTELPNPVYASHYWLHISLWPPLLSYADTGSSEVHYTELMDCGILRPANRKKINPVKPEKKVYKICASFLFTGIMDTIFKGKVYFYTIALLWQWLESCDVRKRAIKTLQRPLCIGTVEFVQQVKYPGWI